MKPQNQRSKTGYPHYESEVYNNERSIFFYFSSLHKMKLHYNSWFYVVFVSRVCL